MMKPMFIHVVAPPSPALYYTVEVAWVDADGNSEVHLIQPTEAWADAMNDLVWSPSNPRPPHFSVRHLLATGENLTWVAKRVLSLLTHPDIRVMAPNHHRVENLLGLLLAEANLPSTVEIGHVLEAYCEACKPLYGMRLNSDESGTIIKRCELAAAAIVGDGQGALLAVRKLWVTWRLITAEAIKTAQAIQEAAA